MFVYPRWNRLSYVALTVRKASLTTSTSTNPQVLTDQFALLKPEYSPTKYPIVLCHGFSGFDSLVFLPKPNFWRRTTVRQVIREGLLKVDYWWGIQDQLTKIGCEVFIAKVPAFGTIKQRAESLNDFLNSRFEGEDVKKVNLIAHSMGGLDARYLISKLPQKTYEVASLTTVSSPHRGSEVADFIMDHVTIENLLPLAIPQLTTNYMRQFNKEILDDTSVEYFSYGAQFKPRRFNIFKYPSYLINAPNDGLVSVESAKWGRYLGTLDQVDHLDLINWTNRLRTVMDKVLFQHNPSFNALAFYAHIANGLSNRGF